MIEVHDALLAHNFKELAYTPNLPRHIKDAMGRYRYKYISERQLPNNQKIEVVLVFDTSRFERWPRCMLINPKGLALINPAHVELPEGTYCYIETSQYNIFQHDTASAVTEVVELIDAQLKKSLSGENREEIDLELESYITDSYHIPLFYNPKGKYQVNTYKLPNDSIHQIMVPTDGSANACINDDWVYTGTKSTIYIPIGKPLKHLDMLPINDFKKFYHWLNKLSPVSGELLATELRALIRKNIPLNHGVHLLFGYEHPSAAQEQFFVAYLKIDKLKLKDFKHVTTKRLRHALLNLVIDHVFTKKPLGISAFEIGLVEDIHPARNIIRNCGEHHFMDQHIVVIGAGTLGGYLLQQLVSMGAGIGTTKHTASLVIIDNDILAVGNISRHVLGYRDVHHKKADQMKAYLLNQSPSSKIESVPEKLTSNNFKSIFPSKPTLIIDATGDVHTSHTIARMHREHFIETPLLHGWIEFGRVGEMLAIINGRGCYQCLTTPRGEKRFIRSNDDTFQVKRHCSSVYIPFSANVSVEASAHMINAVQDVLFKNIKSTVYFPMQSDSLKAYKTQRLTPLAGCTCCS